MVLEEKKDAGSSFSPGGEVANVQKRMPRAHPEASLFEGEGEFYGVHVVQMIPCRGEFESRVMWQDQMDKPVGGCISG